MSYILDALRKADAERVRGAVPDLHAQPMASGASDFGLPERSGFPWAWLVGGAALALLAAVAWRLFFSGPASAPAPMPAPSPVTTLTQPLSPAASPASAAVPAVAASAPASAADATPAPPPKRPRRERRVSSGKVAREATAAEPATPPAAAARSASAGQGSAAAPAKLPKLAELPEPVRRSLPALAIGGAVYSPQPQARMVIVNGQVAREGETLAPGLQLEQIGPKSAVFSIRGQRFEVPL